jgi:hypothetical protein
MYNVADLLRHGANGLQEQMDKEPLYLIECYVNHAGFEDDKPTFFASYWKREEEDLEREADIHLEIETEGRREKPTKEVTFVVDPSLHPKLNGFTQRLSQGKEQSDPVKLIRSVADTIDAQTSVHILDVVYHDYMDEDGLNHPYMNVYFTSSSKKSVATS